MLMFCYPEEQKLGFFHFLGFDSVKLGQKLLLRIDIKFESKYVLPLTLQTFAIQKSKNSKTSLKLVFVLFFKLQFGENL